MTANFAVTPSCFTCGPTDKPLSGWGPFCSEECKDIANLAADQAAEAMGLTSASLLRLREAEFLPLSGACSLQECLPRLTARLN